jgi:chromosome segregation ATPase
VELRAKLTLAEERAMMADALKTEVETLRQRLAETPLTLDTPISEGPETGALRSRISELETSLERALARPAETVVLDTPDTVARVHDLEAALERMQRQASEAEALRTQVATLEARLAEAQAQVRTPAAGEEAGELKARLADVEARLVAGTQASAQASADIGALRHRIQLLEAMLHEAAKSRDEAAVLRAKVAELDGRLGQAMKSLAEARLAQAGQGKGA